MSASSSSSSSEGSAATNDDWESVGYDDSSEEDGLAPTSVTLEPDSEERQPEVLLELPPGGLLLEMHPPETASSTSTLSSCVVGPASTTTSFAALLHRMENLSIPSSDCVTAHSEEKTATTTTCCSVTTWDVVSLSGRVYRRCKRCSYHNSEHVSICTKCDLALRTNPCQDQDAQIARSLQHKEEQEALHELQRLEQNRKNLAEWSLFEQTTYLLDQIQTVVSVELGPPLVSSSRMVTHASMTLQTAAFIDTVRSTAHDDEDYAAPAKVWLAYKFTHDDPVIMAHLARDGFQDDTRVSKTVETAMYHFYTTTKDKVRRTTSSESPRLLCSIPAHYKKNGPLLENAAEEAMLYTHNSSSSGGCSGSCTIGWIVAVVENTTKPLLSRRDPENNSNYYRRLTVLPLVSFPSSERYSYLVQKRAFGRLEQVCEDFFSIISTTATKNASTTTTSTNAMSYKCEVNDENCNHAAVTPPKFSSLPTAAKTSSPPATTTNGGTEEATVASYCTIDALSASNNKGRQSSSTVSVSSNQRLSFSSSQEATEVDASKGTRSRVEGNRPGFLARQVGRFRRRMASSSSSTGRRTRVVNRPGFWARQVARVRRQRMTFFSSAQPQPASVVVNAERRRQRFANRQQELLARQLDRIQYWSCCHRRRRHHQDEGCAIRDPYHTYPGSK
jgi:hypothetical protein